MAISEYPHGSGATIDLEDERLQLRQVDERALAQMIASAAPHARVVLDSCDSCALSPSRTAEFTASRS